jgi:hypothetical protein
MLPGLHRVLMLRKSRLRTGLALDRLREVLSRVISEAGKGEEAGETPLQGCVGENTFEVRRVNVYRSSYLPLMKGRLVDCAGGAEIELFFRPHRQVVIFLSIWATFLLLASLLITVASLGAGSARLWLLLIPLGLGALTWILSLRVFDGDCRWVLEAFEDALREDMA